MSRVMAQVVRVAEDGPDGDQPRDAEQNQDPEELDRNGSPARQLDPAPGMGVRHAAIEVGLEPLAPRQPPENPVDSHPTLERESARVEAADHRTLAAELGGTA